MKTMNPLVEHLNQQLANLNVLYVKLQNYHWYVKGEQFFVLHEKFQDFYEQLPPVIDEIAERILTIGGEPIGTLQLFAKHASIKEAQGEEQAMDMVARLEEDYRLLAEEMNRGVKLAEEADDPSTADLYTGLAADLEKKGWLLRSYLAKALQHT